MTSLLTRGENYPVSRFLPLVALVGFAVALSLAPARAQERFTLRAEKRPLQEFLREVADITGKNFLIDSQVRGSVTFVSPRTLTRDEVWEVAKSALSLNGFAIVEYGGIVKIVPKDRIAHQPIPTAPPKIKQGSREDFITTIIDLKYISALEAMESVRLLLGPEGKMAPSPGKPALVVVDSAANTDRIRKLLSRFDTKEAAQELSVIPLKRASASQVAQIMTELFIKAGGIGGLGCPCRFTSEPRSNSLLVRAPAAESRAARRLSQKLDGQDPKISIQALRHMDAEAAQKLLENLANPL